MNRENRFHPIGKYAEKRKARNRLIDALRQEGLKGARAAIRQYLLDMKEIGRSLYMIH